MRVTPSSAFLSSCSSTSAVAALAAASSLGHLSAPLHLPSSPPLPRTPRTCAHPPPDTRAPVCPAGEPTSPHCAPPPSADGLRRRVPGSPPRSPARAHLTPYRPRPPRRAPGRHREGAPLPPPLPLRRVLAVPQCVTLPSCSPSTPFLPPSPAPPRYLPGVLLCFGGALSEAGLHHVALVSPDGDYVVERASFAVLCVPVPLADLSPAALGTIRTLLTSPPVHRRPLPRHLPLPHHRPPPSLSPRRRPPLPGSPPPWSFDPFPLFLPADVYRSPPLSHVLDSTPVDEGRLPLDPTSRPLVSPPASPPPSPPRLAPPPPARPPPFQLPSPSSPPSYRPAWPRGAWTPPSPESSATSPTWSPPRSAT